jgi:hypothetical protein
VAFPQTHTLSASSPGRRIDYAVRNIDSLVF